MKKLALLISSALLMSAQAFAAVQDSRTFELNAQVPESCQITLHSAGNMETNMDPTTPYKADVILKCNHPNGAAVTLSTLNGGLKHTTRADITKAYNYTATLDLAVYGEPNLVLKANTAGASSTENIDSPTGITNLASGGVPSYLTVNGVEDMTTAVAGLYQDELTLTVVSL